MRTLLYIIVLMTILLTNCTNESDAVIPGEGSLVGMADSVAVGLGASVHQHAGKTRMSEAATQANGVFRGISDFFLIPYATEGEIGPDDVPLKQNIEIGRMLSASSLISNNHAVFFHPVFVPKQTASFLVYGHAPSAANPFAYGSLTGFNDITSQTKTSDITFSLDHIYTGSDVPTIGQELADYLTSIATVQYVLPTAYYGNIFYRVQRTPTYKWSNPDSYDHSALANAFEFFVNEDRVMGGSSSLISSLLTKLYNTLYPIATSDPTAINYYGDNNATTPLGTIYPYRELATAIRTAIASSDYVAVTGYMNQATVELKSPRHDYPGTNIGLPDGAACLQWNGSNQEFEVVMQTKASAKIMSASRFCYPPLLCYYANSQIKISDDNFEREHYIASNSWAQILDEYKSSSKSVNSKTRAIAIKETINYGVAQFRVCLKPSLRLLDVGNVHEIIVNGENFRLTGLIVGPQYDVAYNFDPLLSSDDHTIYDPLIADGNNNSIYLLPYETTAFAQTLTLPTRKDEVVYFVLEFENKSGVDFYGANGLILNGSKFYMTAKLDPKEGTGYNAEDNNMNRVFAQDGYTEVSCQIKDLKGAWNVVPDLRDPQLEIGISMETKWIQSTTTNVRLD